MLKTVEGRYRDGRLELDEPVPEGVEARVVLMYPVDAGNMGKPGSYRALGGLISAEDVETMIRVIEEDCERIDPDTW